MAQARHEAYKLEKLTYFVFVVETMTKTNLEVLDLPASFWEHYAILL